MSYERLDMQQGTDEWLALRRQKITATDAPIIMGVSPWRSPLQLYHAKVDGTSDAPTERMRRGSELEPFARLYFQEATGISVAPAVVVDGWRMASLDGLSADGATLVEIKCPSQAVHDIAVSGKVPVYYMPQLQHQLAITGLPQMYYYSYSGSDGVIVEVQRDQPYIDRLTEAEAAFYECLVNRVPPPTRYLSRNDNEWCDLAKRYLKCQEMRCELERLEDELRGQLIALCGDADCQGAGITVARIERRGAIDYGNVPELNNVDLDKYRKPSVKSWRISQNI